MLRLKHTLLASAFAAVLFTLPAQAFDRQLCDVCRRVWLDSPCRVSFALTHGDSLGRGWVCSPTCMFEALESYPEFKLERPEVVAWPDREELQPLRHKVEDCVWRLNIKGKESKTHPPFCAAFVSKAEAKAAQKELNGELCDWKKVKKACKDAADTEEPGKPGKGKDGQA